MPPQPLDAERTPYGPSSSDEQQDVTPRKLPKGVVLGPDEKPCRTCSSGSAFASWAAMTKKQSPASPSSTTNSLASSASSSQLLADCPPDVEGLGRAAWTLLHSMTATYPTSPSSVQQTDARQFLSSFSRLYPCWVCAEDFQQWMRDPCNAPRVSSRDEFGQWMCEAHNAVNVKLGKERFNCARWEERWRTGWKDGSCD
ncbi:FAD dependent sulfhydryl oxidase Erv1 [Viridothelium virens]|uniref:Sulfhydryl oxidase n=1 Tax=Viridothelium virens TaxID=1048519 RepID=A0A6A6H2V4_VIRVR|nr:FAD dependent sulfhydryl oxidase Erv1 [Viridothelium virens]